MVGDFADDELVAGGDDGGADEWVVVAAGDAHEFGELVVDGAAVSLAWCAGGADLGMNARVASG